MRCIRSRAGTLLVWFVSPLSPTAGGSAAACHASCFDYGKHIVSSQSLIFLITNVDNAIVGRYVGEAALGFYQFAYNTLQPARPRRSPASSAR